MLHMYEVSKTQYNAKRSRNVYCRLLGLYTHIKLQLTITKKAIILCTVEIINIILWSAKRERTGPGNVSVPASIFDSLTLLKIQRHRPKVVHNFIIHKSISLKDHFLIVHLCLNWSIKIRRAQSAAYQLPSSRPLTYDLGETVDRTVRIRITVRMAYFVCPKIKEVEICCES